MASSLGTLLFFLVASSLAHPYTAQVRPEPLIFHINKDDATGLYYSPIKFGTPHVSMNLMLDIANQWSWFNCEHGYNSSDYSPIPCDTPACTAVGGLGCIGCDGPIRPGCTNDTCESLAYNPFQNTVYIDGIGQDGIIVVPTDGIHYNYQRQVLGIPITCVRDSAVERLPSATQGLIALSRSSASLTTVLFSAFNLPKKLALCLPSSSKLGQGDMYLGGGPYYRPSTDQDFSKSLLVSKLLINPNSTAPVSSEGDASFEYFIDIRAIKVGYTPLSFNNSLLDFDKDGVGGSKISTITPYTKLHSSIYKPLLSEFRKAASKKKISQAAAVAPFGLCFRTKSIGSTKAGPDVPTIVLVLQNDVQWEILGANSMVSVSKDVMCLGFVDGGKKPRTSIVIGGHQMEDNIIEIDVGASTFAFSNSLLTHNTSCAHISLRLIINS